MTASFNQTLRNMIHDFRKAWKPLILTDLVYTAIALSVLTPLVSLLLRVTLALSGREILADQDILYFLLGPVGWISFVLVNSVVIAVMVLEQAALMIVLAGAAQEKLVSVRQALGQTLPLTQPILHIIARLLARVLLTTAPFALGIGVVYFLLLREYDINYYLTQKPPAFWWAVALTGTLLLGLGLTLLRVLLPAIYALPIHLFEKVPPHKVMRVSRQRTQGQLPALAGWIVVWFLITILLSTMITSLTGLLGKLIIPLVQHSLWQSLLTTGVLLILWSLVNLVLTVLGVATLAVMLINLYRGKKDQAAAVLAFPLRTEKKDSFLFRLSRLQWSLAFSLALIVTLSVGAWILLSLETKDQVDIIAHRGASAVAPENSMAAVEQAIADRADWVEIDVQESADGQVLVIHDEDLKRLAGRNLKVWNTPARQLRQVDIGRNFAPEFGGQRVPTLEEVLLACKGKAGVIIELKHYGRAQKLEQRVIDIVEALAMQEQIQIMSLKYDSVKKVRTLRPSWPVGLLSAVSVGRLSKVNANFLAVSTRIATRPFIRSAQRRKKDVYVWTVNNPVEMSTMISRGVKGIITDKPALAQEVLRQRSELSITERLLLEVTILFGSPSHLANNRNTTQ